MPFYCEESLSELENRHAEVSQIFDTLILGYTHRSYRHDRAREHAIHGFARRLMTMKRCIDNTFSNLPPGRESSPSSEEIADTQISIQAFAFNVFGSIDNLAWVWVEESELVRPNGNAMQPRNVGLRTHHIEVRESLSPAFRECLDGLDDWFDHLDKFRHALAHRIPLYIPPYTVSPDNEEAHDDLERSKTSAAARWDFKEYDRLENQQTQLGNFRPIMTHSFEENADVIMFHGQLLCDFLTVDLVARKMLEELDLLEPPDAKE